MRSRLAGMWWGTAVECAAPGELARFYAELLDLPVVHDEPGTAVVATSPQGPFFVFQQVPDYRPPAWPPAES